MASPILEFSIGGQSSIKISEYGKNLIFNIAFLTGKRTVSNLLLYIVKRILHLKTLYILEDNEKAKITLDNFFLSSF